MIHIQCQVVCRCNMSEVLILISEACTSASETDLGITNCDSLGEAGGKACQDQRGPRSRIHSRANLQHIRSYNVLCILEITKCPV
jgi:hypothetical protein